MLMLLVLNRFGSRRRGVCRTSTNLKGTSRGSMGMGMEVWPLDLRGRVRVLGLNPAIVFNH